MGEQATESDTSFPWLLGTFWDTLLPFLCLRGLLPPPVKSWVYARQHGRALENYLLTSPLF